MYAKMNGWKVYYEVRGSGEPVLFIHGTPTSAFLWRRQIDALSERYRVYAIDLPGWARSEKPDGFDYKLESYADVIKQFLDTMGEKKIVLGIHDLGGAVGMTFVGRYPEMVSKLILFDTFAYLPFTKKAVWKLLYDFLLALPLLGLPLHRFIWEIFVRRSELTRNYFATLAFYDKKLANKTLVDKYKELANSSQEADFKTLAGNINNITGAVEQNSFKVNVPTLILWAENDMLFPTSAAEKLHRYINGSVLKTIPKCGHWLQEEKPDEVNRHVLEFLVKR